MDTEGIFETIIAISIMILIGVLVYNGYIKQDDKKFYDGCQCGGHWEYQQAVGHQVSTSYIYKCDKCGNVVEFDNYYKEEREEN